MRHEVTRPVDAPGKIKRLKDLEPVLRAARKAGKKVALCHGVFDVVHPGHIVHFKEAAHRADLVVVTVTPDRFVNKGPGRPVFNESLRLEALAAVEYVDHVVLNEWPTAVETIALLKPDLYVKGAQYADPRRDVTEKIKEEEEAVRKAGGKLVFTGGFTASSSSIINRFFSVYPPETQEYLRDFGQRHGSAGIIRQMKRLSKLRALVVGEAILDEYCYCIPLGKSPKEFIVATKFLSEERFAGGAAATANHVAGFCGEVALVTALGPDPGDREFFAGKSRPNVSILPLVQAGRPTIRKRRFLEPAFLTKMFEIQHLDDAAMDAGSEARLGAIIEKQAPKCDLVIVNDFGHGMLTKKLRDFLSSTRKFVALNTQTNSANMGFNAVTNYRRADYVVIDEPELRLAARDKYGALPELVARTRRSLRARDFVVSRGPSGSAVLSNSGWAEAPALATRIVDRTGAGDALFAVTSPCARLGMAPEVLAFVGNCAGALAVETVCNREPVDPVRLYRFLESLLR
ncbi:MAG: adenylyltransferase/cytidyltransferase family protein [Elusimicrobia bacterium]|nr:adenylyltransferase/cytidyltransferase family protein [Elusimicrobiota bacterium]